MPTGLIYDDRFLDHRPGSGHPERPERLTAIRDRLRDQHLLKALVPLSFDAATRDDLCLVHDPDYVDRVFEACRQGREWIDDHDVGICKHSADVAALACGGVVTAAEAVWSGQIVTNALCLVRPPGHHAERDEAMGFCLFNNVAVGAAAMIERHNLERVAIIDWDVHHGNGTQHIFEGRADVLVINIHEHPRWLYPNTGYVHEVGTGPGEGYTLNLPMDRQFGDDDFRHAFVFKLGPALERFAPQMIFISAGFDAAEDDPIAHLAVSAEGFRWMTRYLKRQAEHLCDGKIVSVLEGGYHLPSLTQAVELHVRSLMQPPGQDSLMAMKSGL